jgi:PTH1 family peptidyl-tRNA hydrolase
MFLCVGLGNPGNEYALHRHNIGFMMLDMARDHFNAPPFKKKYQGQFSEGRIDQYKVGFLKPETFMNKSGVSVAEAARFYKIPTSHIIVFHDELDLAAGKVKVKIGGGNAGHNGLRSMDQHLPDNNYIRIRVGIGHPGHRDRVTGHVLGNYSKDEQKWLPELISIGIKELPLILQGDHELYMTRVAASMQSYLS